MIARLSRAAPALTAGACLLWPPPVTAMPTILGVQNAPTAVSAYGGYVVWSAGDFDFQGRLLHGGYRLVVAYRGRSPVTLPVARRPVPFDAAVGPGPAGHAEVVFSRCRREPELGSEWYRDGTDPPYESGVGCRIEAYDLVTHTQRRLASTAAPGRSEFFSTLWRNRVAFVADLRRNGPQRIEVSDLRPGGRTRLVRRLDRGWSVAGLALYGRRLAFVRNVVDADCRRYVIENPIQIPSELWLGTLGHRLRRIARGCSTEPTVRLASPSFAGGRLFYIARRQDGVRLRSRSLVTGVTSASPGPACISSLSAGDALYLSQMTSCPSPEPDDPLRYEIDRFP